MVSLEKSETATSDGPKNATNNACSSSFVSMTTTATFKKWFQVLSLTAIASSYLLMNFHSAHQQNMFLLVKTTVIDQKKRPSYHDIVVNVSSPIFYQEAARQPHNNSNCPTSDDSDDLLSMESCSNIVKSTRRDAEQLWKQNQGYLWMQHARKAGGTSLCMNLRLNSQNNNTGLIKIIQHDRTIAAGHHSTTTRRQTCQIRSFCSDCDYRRKPWYTVASLAPTLKRAMHENEQNFVEIEAAGVPVDMVGNDNATTLSNNWNDFVFVSTIRHPIDRIVSLLHSTRCHGNETCYKEIKRTFESNVLNLCNQSLYACASNYFVRMFSGMDTMYTTNQEMLQLAKRNFLRFSCVLIVEYWDETIKCLDQNLGLSLKLKEAYNVGGNMNNHNMSHSTTAAVNRSQYLSNTELELLISYNTVDMEFYEWAKNLILSGRLYD